MVTTKERIEGSEIILRVDNWPKSRMRKVCIIDQYGNVFKKYVFRHTKNNKFLLPPPNKASQRLSQQALYKPSRFLSLRTKILNSFVIS